MCFDPKTENLLPVKASANLALFIEYLDLRNVMSLTIKSDRFLLTMYVIEFQIQDLNPNTLQAGSLQAPLPHCLLFPGLKPEPNSNSEKLMKSINPKLHAPMPHLQKDSFSPTNESAGLVNNPKITGATSGKESKKLSVECGLLEDGKSYSSMKN
ncbi:hypothetical protein DSO57_1001832 [Entomophthora muscae]|uniref:Uncharacterized protein n=1 Tax=Entomophthora muscae TaxID=34485 RepID=A0ACC2U888_9FUNG|nr:hypothetical protein DSO57_1001832 [Entomophthora muscae]